MRDFWGHEWHRPGSILILLVALAAALAAGCPGKGEEGPVAFSILRTCLRVPQPTERVFTTAEEWEEFLGRYAGAEAPPAVDFGRFVLAARFDGTGSACMVFTVEGVGVKDGQVVVRATRNLSPDPCTAVLAFPQVVVTVARRDLPVVFRIGEVVRPVESGARPCL